ncbi:hypothetical protein [Neobacillus notoginsengisoli]|nr:hypothetical protein [Neobacillus notoginsengisoli]
MKQRNQNRTDQVKQEKKEPLSKKGRNTQKDGFRYDYDDSSDVQ